MEYPSLPQEDRELDYLQLILRRKWLIAAVTLIAAIAALIISAYQQKTYQASSLFEIGGIAGTDERGTPVSYYWEDIKTVSEVLKSDAVLFQLKEKIALPPEVRINSLKNAVQIKIIRNEIINQPTALLEISFKSTDPEKTIAGLNFLMGYIIAEHTKRYESGIKNFNAQLALVLEKIANNTTQKQRIEEKIKKINEQIHIDNQYRTVVKNQAEKLEQDVKETKQRLTLLDPKTITPLEILFLQSNLRGQEDQTASFQRELNNLELGNKERQKQINDFESQIAALSSQAEDLRLTQIQLENHRRLTQNTQIKSPPVFPTQPVSPNKKRNVVFGTGVGLLLSLILAFAIEYSPTRKRH